MIRIFEQTDADALRRVGIVFRTEEETALFLSCLRRAAEIRLGGELEAEMPELMELPLGEDEAVDEVMGAWVRDHEETFQRMKERVEEALERELLAWRGQIPGVLPCPEAILCDTPLEDLNLSVRSYNCLRRAGYHTAGEVAACRDFTRIRSLGAKNAAEITEALRAIGLAA